MSIAADLNRSGVMALKRRQPHVALDYFIAAIRDDSSFTAARANTGLAFEDMGRDADAERVYRAATSRSPEADSNLARLLRRQTRLDEAVELLQWVLSRRPDAYAEGLLAEVLVDCGRTAEAGPHYYNAFQLTRLPLAYENTLYHALHFQPDPEPLFKAHASWGRATHARWAKDRKPLDNDRSPDRPLRVGYVSPDFREHTVARFIGPILANHSSEFVSVCYSDVRRPDEITGHLRALAGEWRDTAGLTDPRLAELIRADRIDVLVDLTQHMGANRLEVFARKPAPVQVAYPGSPFTTGLPTMDYFISPEACEPEGSERLYVEKLIRLPMPWCYDPGETPDVGPPPSARYGFVTFGAMHRAGKITPQSVELWSAVLAAVPGSRLHVQAPGGEKNRLMRTMLESAGIAADRLTLLAPVPRREFLARITSTIDIALDAFPYNGMTTTCDALWMGVPVVTLAGQTHASRVGMAMLECLKMGHYVAQSPARFAEIAGHAAKFPVERERLRRWMRQSPLMNGRLVTARLEQAYRAFWRTLTAASTYPPPLHTPC